MYYLILNKNNQELKELFPQGVPTFDSLPDEIIEIYDEFGDFMDIQPAFRVNIEGLTSEEELKLFNLYASNTDDPRLIQGSFKLLANAWITIPEDQVDSVVWREGEKVFCFECKDIAASLR